MYYHEMLDFQLKFIFFYGVIIDKTDVHHSRIIYITSNKQCQADQHIQTAWNVVNVKSSSTKGSLNAIVSVTSSKQHPVTLFKTWNEINTESTSELCFALLRTLFLKYYRFFFQVVSTIMGTGNWIYSAWMYNIQ